MIWQKGKTMGRDICDEGACNLIRAIVNSAKNDVLRCSPVSEVRKDAERFFRSRWFEALTGFSGIPMLRQLQAEYDRKHKKKGVRRA